MPVMLAAAATQPFANGRWIVPAIAWLAPMLLLRVVRSRRHGLAIGWLLFTLGWVVQWWDIVNLPRAWFALVAAGCGTAGFLPYVADRLIAQRLHGIVSTLVFPAALATIEWLLATITPNGSWGSLAYTQCRRPAAPAARVDHRHLRRELPDRVVRGDRQLRVGASLLDAAVAARDRSVPRRDRGSARFRRRTIGNASTRCADLARRHRRPVARTRARPGTRCRSARRFVFPQRARGASGRRS